MCVCVRVFNILVGHRCRGAVRGGGGFWDGLYLNLLLSCVQAGKKAVRAVLWVSADGLRVVDDKTKVTPPSL